VAEADRFTAATITAHHLLYNRNAIFMGGMRPHYYCLPVLKRETHRVALVQAATSGSSQVLPGHRQRAAPRAPEGARQRLRRLLHRPRRHGDVCRGV
jgi:dihydroorotase